MEGNALLMVKNVLIFGADMSCSIHATNRANDIYCFGEGLTQGINDTTIYAEKNYWRNFTEHGEKCVLSLHYNGDDSYLFVNSRQELKFKAKNDQFVKEKLCIRNLSNQSTTSESAKTGLYGNIYDFAVDYEAIIGVGQIYDMHRFLMTKHNVLPLYKMSEYFPPYNNSMNKIKVELDLSNYATKDDVKNITHVDASNFASKTNLAALKTEVDKIDTDVQRDNALINGRDYYCDKMYLLYECKTYSFKYVGGGSNNWKSTGIDNSTDSDMNLTAHDHANLPTIINNGRMNVKFKGGYYKQSKLIKPNNNNVINVYIVYKLDPVSNTRDDTFTVQNALFGGIKLTKNTDTSKYKYEGYGICFDEGGVFSVGNITDGKNVLIFGVHENSVVHSNNKTNNIFIMGDGFVQGINDTTLYAEKIYSKNFSAVDEKFVLSLHYNGDNSYLFVNGKQELKFKAKDDQIVKKILCLGNLSDDWTALNATKTGLYGTVYMILLLIIQRQVWLIFTTFIGI